MMTTGARILGVSSKKTDKKPVSKYKKNVKMAQIESVLPREAAESAPDGADPVHWLGDARLVQL